MTILDILVAPDPRLKKAAEPVRSVDDGLRALMDDMLETMYAAPGIGLAAPQVGISKRITVIDVADRKAQQAEPIFVVNPEITWRSDQTVVAEEGCLSLPEQFADVRRHEAVEVRFLDRDGAERTVKAEGLLARCLQHEIDHLDGVLFVDRISALKRQMIMRKLAKKKRQERDQA